jgi:hypothetical protein
MSQETVTETFAVGAGARLTLNNLRGDVAIGPGADGEIAVTAVKHLDSGDPDRTRIVLRRAGDDHVVVETRLDEERPHLFSSRSFEPCRVDYTVRVPAACAVTASGVDSPLDVQALSGDADLNSVSGPISLRDLAGPLRVNTVSGPVAGERLRVAGRLQVQTVSGDVHLADCDVAALHAETVSGRVWLETRLGQGPYRADSVSGDLILVVPAGSKCALALHTMSGSLRSALPTGRFRQRDGVTHVSVGEGGPEVTLHSVSGDLVLALPPGAAPPAPVDRLGVLAQVARGELSVEAAVAALQA